MSLSLRAKLAASVLAVWALPVGAAIEAPSYGANDMNGGSWTAGGGSRLISGPQQCVYSTSNRNNTDRGNPTDYRVTATIQGSGQSNFMLTHTGSGATLPFTLSYRSCVSLDVLISY